MFGRRGYNWIAINATEYQIVYYRQWELVNQDPLKVSLPLNIYELQYSLPKIVFHSSTGTNEIKP